MKEPFWSGSKSRRIVKRIVVSGDLVLQTPAHFGNGDASDQTDMPLLVDPADSKSPLLTGASLAGALRSYLRARERGYLKQLPDPKNKKDENAIREERESFTTVLFGGFREDDEGEQSALIIDDAIRKPGSFGIEMREGVQLESDSRTAKKDHLFNLHLWQAGTTFVLRFELLICQPKDEAQTEAHSEKLKRALATALQGLSDGGITLGARKRRGYGQVKVAEWRMTAYDLTSTDGLLARLASQRTDLNVRPPEPKTGSDIATLLGVESLGDLRREFTLCSKFALNGSLLIRSGSGLGAQDPDTAHLHSTRRNEQDELSSLPILSGTSLGGAMRARALRIALTLANKNLARLENGNQSEAEKLVDAMWGADMEKLKKERKRGNKNAKPFASRVSVKETVITVKPEASLVQNRIRIDRFTSGASETALFSEQPIFSDGKEQAVEISLSLRNPEDYEIGLLLLALKDLWTGDLPLGGEASVGRGRLRGLEADLKLGHDHWKFSQTDPESPVAFHKGDRASLENFVSTLRKKLLGE
jgi:CRISPR/Cas system CSM-associated protein Csm3 (group 7 of RAMP superfamily)